MSFTRHQKLILTFCAIILLGGGCALPTKQPPEPQGASATPSEPTNSSTSSTNEVVPLAPYNERIGVFVDGQTVKNTDCNFTFKIPEGWSVGGLLGESKILSPEDRQTNEEWYKANQDLIQRIEEGDGPLGPDKRTLYISCQYDRPIDDLKKDAFKAIKINGRDAYELSEVSETRAGTTITHHRIFLVGTKTMTIELDQTEYDDLSDAVKQIIQSISFEE